MCSAEWGRRPGGCVVLKEVQNRRWPDVAMPGGPGQEQTVSATPCHGQQG